MKPTDIKGCNVVYGDTMPAIKTSEVVITCWELSDEDIAEIIRTKKIYVGHCAIDEDLQPHAITSSIEDLLFLDICDGDCDRCEDCGD